MKKGEIVIIPFPFTNLTGSKLRPAIVLFSDLNDVTLCFLTTQNKYFEETDLPISPSEINGLKKESIIRVSKISTIEKSLVLGKIGELDTKELQQIDTILLKLLKINI